MNKTCLSCTTPKSDRSKFYPNKKSKDRLQYRCKDCARKLIKESYSHDKYKENYCSLKARGLTLRKYGLTIEDYDNLLSLQKGVCGICKTSECSMENRSLAVDHDHISGRVRGLLCMKCNTSLGRFQDDIDVINRIIDYLTGNPNFSPIQITLDDIVIPAYNRKFVNEIKFRYNITYPEYLAKLLEQKGLCAICWKLETRIIRGIVTRLGVDHDHATGHIRGLLCFGCNTALGYFDDDMTWPDKAVEYLRGGQR